ncbi:MAG: DUF1232 domain-containing protein [Chloroflexi bacterium]|nr:DUF1232 domain-containing protein [Chloroflexota bacterium]
MAGQLARILLKFWYDLKLMAFLLYDFIRRVYPVTPKKALTSMTVALIYFLVPFDVIPDFIPLVGYLDDALLLKFALDFAREDLDAYLIWKGMR